MNILQVFTIDFSEIQFIVNHNSQSDGPNKSAKSGTNLRKKTILVNSLQRKEKIQRTMISYSKQSRQKMGLWNFDLITKPLSWWTIVHTTNQENQLKNLSIQVNRDEYNKDKRFLRRLLLQRPSWPTCRMAILAFISKFLVVVRIRMELEVNSQNFYFAQISLFCYSRFRLQLIAIHCDRRVCRQIHLTRDFASTLSSLCTHHIVAQGVARCVCIKHVHPHVITCLSVCCFLVLSSSSVSRASTFSLTHFNLFSVLNFNSRDVENAGALNRKRTRKMRGIAPWRFSTLSQFAEPVGTSSFAKIASPPFQHRRSWLSGRILNSSPRRSVFFPTCYFLKSNQTTSTRRLIKVLLRGQNRTHWEERFGSPQPLRTCISENQPKYRAACSARERLLMSGPACLTGLQQQVKWFALKSTVQSGCSVQSELTSSMVRSSVWWFRAKSCHKRSSVSSRVHHRTCAKGMSCVLFTLMATQIPMYLPQVAPGERYRGRRHHEGHTVRGRCCWDLSFRLRWPKQENNDWLGGGWLSPFGQPKLADFPEKARREHEELRILVLGSVHAAHTGSPHKVREESVASPN